jgi:murein DD-endopeptidase MepM/ murein hydrolase activator NlpD
MSHSLENRKIIFLLCALLAIISFIYVLSILKLSNLNSNANQLQETTLNKQKQSSERSSLSVPMTDWQQRVTVRPFGIKISPKERPNDRFFGYHSGADFEIFPGEENNQIDVRAICSGPLLQKNTALGYGGVAVQECMISGETMTIIYGHLKIQSISWQPGQEILAGEKIGILGKGASTETDGERKHLHLGIHKGEGLDIKGYVQSLEELRDWLDPVEYLK